MFVCVDFSSSLLMWSSNPYAVLCFHSLHVACTHCTTQTEMGKVRNCMLAAAMGYCYEHINFVIVKSILCDKM